jgi:hypothetical protein
MFSQANRADPCFFEKDTLLIFSADTPVDQHRFFNLGEIEAVASLQQDLLGEMLPRLKKMQEERLSGGELSEAEIETGVHEP